jgi:hypothetical protein
MSAETKKLYLIEELLKVDSDVILSKVERILSKHRAKLPRSNGFIGFKSLLTLDEVNEMERNIEEGCGTNQSKFALIRLISVYNPE